MVSSTLRNAGGSVIMTVPKPVLDELGLQANTTVDVTAVDGKMVVAVQKRPKYTLDELLAQCDFNAPWSEEDLEWFNNPPVGRELI